MYENINKYLSMFKLPEYEFKFTNGVIALNRVDEPVYKVLSPFLFNHLVVDELYMEELDEVLGDIPLQRLHRLYRALMEDNMINITPIFNIRRKGTGIIYIILMERGQLKLKFMDIPYDVYTDDVKIESMIRNYIREIYSVDRKEIAFTLTDELLEGNEDIVYYMDISTLSSPAKSLNSHKGLSVGKYSVTDQYILLQVKDSLIRYDYDGIMKINTDDLIQLTSVLMNRREEKDFTTFKRYLLDKEKEMNEEIEE